MLSHVFSLKESNQEINRIFWDVFAYLQKSLCNIRNHIVNQILTNGSWFFVENFLLFGCEFFQVEFLFNLFVLLHIFLLFILIVVILFIFGGTFLVLILNDISLFDFLLEPQRTILKSI